MEELFEYHPETDPCHIFLLFNLLGYFIFIHELFYIDYFSLPMAVEQRIWITRIVVILIVITAIAYPIDIPNYSLSLMIFNLFEPKGPQKSLLFFNTEYMIFNNLLEPAINRLLPFMPPSFLLIQYLLITGLYFIAGIVDKYSAYIIK